MVGAVADGFSAVRLAQDQRPDVLLMDVRMPGLDGIAATRGAGLRHPVDGEDARGTRDDQGRRSGSGAVGRGAYEAGLGRPGWAQIE